MEGKRRYCRQFGEAVFDISIIHVQTEQNNYCSILHVQKNGKWSMLHIPPIKPNKQTNKHGNGTNGSMTKSLFFLSKNNVHHIFTMLYRRHPLKRDRV